MTRPCCWPDGVLLCWDVLPAAPDPPADDPECCEPAGVEGCVEEPPFPAEEDEEDDGVALPLRGENSTTKRNRLRSKTPGRKKRTCRHQNDSVSIDLERPRKLARSVGVPAFHSRAGRSALRPNIPDNDCHRVPAWTTGPERFEHISAVVNPRQNVSSLAGVQQDKMLS